MARQRERARRMKPLRALRLDSGFSQREAAAIYGCSQAFMSFAEHGKRTMRRDREHKLRRVLEAASEARQRIAADLSRGRALREHFEQLAAIESKGRTA
jgi:transcriptional regulator with XRE-family HTH domain